MSSQTFRDGTEPIPPKTAALVEPVVSTACLGECLAQAPLQRFRCVGILLAINGAKDLWFLPQNWVAQPLIVDLGPFLLIHLAHGHGFPFAVFLNRAFENAGIETRFHYRIGVSACHLLRVHKIVCADAERVGATADKIDNHIQLRSSRDHERSEVKQKAQGQAAILRKDPGDAPWCRTRVVCDQR